MCECVCKCTQPIVAGGLRTICEALLWWYLSVRWVIEIQFRLSTPFSAEPSYWLSFFVFVVCSTDWTASKQNNWVGPHEVTCSFYDNTAPTHSKSQAGTRFRNTLFRNPLLFSLFPMFSTSLLSCLGTVVKEFKLLPWKASQMLFPLRNPLIRHHIEVPEKWCYN